MICEHCGMKVVKKVANDFDMVSFVERSLCEYFNTTMEALDIKNRKREVVYKRQVFMYFLKEKTDLSLNQIGVKFSRDHTTVIHARNVINDLIFSDPQVRKEIEEIREIINVVQ